MSAKPTQGDWKQEGRAIYAGNTYVGYAPWCDDVDAGLHEQGRAPVSEDESIANAKLMASSRKLLKALQMLLKEREACELLLAEYDPGYKGDYKDKNGRFVDDKIVTANSPGMNAAREAIAAAGGVL